MVTGINIEYKRNDASDESYGNYDVYLSGYKVGTIIGKSKKWDMINLFGTELSSGRTRDLTVKKAISDGWEYEQEYKLFNVDKELSDIIELTEIVGTLDEDIKAEEKLKGKTQDNSNDSGSLSALGDDYQPVSKKHKIKSFIKKLMCFQLF